MSASPTTELPALGAEHFAPFFEAVHGHRPFPWQQRLVDRLLSGQGWPELLDLPTGTGKTAALDAALFHLAATAHREPCPAPRRIVYVVDRRTVVDQAFVRASALLGALKTPTGPHAALLGAVRARLAWLSSEREPLVAVQLRGGMPRSDAWARAPHQPVIAVSTVDQVGSRLLFRGYGVSGSMMPVHAGLLGHDTLWLLDEVHLSEPFRQTLDAVWRRYRGWAEQPLPGAFSVVALSATAGATHRTSPEAILSLNDDDRAHPVLASRLVASKPTRLQLDLKSTALEDAAAEAAAGFAQQAHRAVGVVVNRVSRAVSVAQKLEAQLRGRANVLLVTGRMRPLDRARAEAHLRQAAGVGRQRAEAPKTVVVATQCIEAGADLDFDAMVAECASLDALLQRLGRLNRLGEYPAAEAVVLASTSKGPDPVYGQRLEQTAAWLSEQPAPLDLGIAGQSRISADERAQLSAEKRDAPVLLPAHLDAWVQTSPRPGADPDVSLWLHGPGRGAAEVQVVWRGDLSHALLMQAHRGEGSERASAAQVVEELLAVLPPCSAEAMSLPLAAVKAWLLGAVPAPFSDVEGQEDDEDDAESAKPNENERPLVLCVGGASAEVVVVSPRQIPPHAVVVVPAEYGGLWKGTFCPANTEPVADLAEPAQQQEQGRAVVRLYSAGGELAPLAWPVPHPDRAPRAVVQDWLDAAARAADPGERWEKRWEKLRQSFAAYRVVVVRLSANTDGPAEGFALVERKPKGNLSTTTEGDTGSLVGRAVALEEHLEGVRAHAESFGVACGLPSKVLADVSLAARWHDVGKADPRFQRLLHGGDRYAAELAMEQGALLAKSKVDARDSRSLAHARQASRYPKGARHELLSVAMLQRHPLLSEATDPELVLHLVGSHHGHCRPLAPVVEDAEPLEVTAKVLDVELEAATAHGLERLDSGVGDRFWRLVRRYGWWGLAWLEALVRLADHRQSEAEQRPAEQTNASGER
jgi:CRISPR-associated endonuclease/helicase Cas3